MSIHLLLGVPYEYSVGETFLIAQNYPKNRLWQRQDAKMASTVMDLCI
jgi:hypothetical protein